MEGERYIHFSVIVPTQHRPVSLDRCLLALEDQAYPREHTEVIVVRSPGRGDPSCIAARHPGLHVRLVDVHERGPAAARNRGAQLAGGERLAFLDDDAVPDPGWLMALANAHRLEPRCIHAGRVIPRALNLPSRATQAIADAALGTRPDGSTVLAQACNLSVPSERFRQLGGFDPDFSVSEDREFCARWLSRGWSIRRAPEAIVEHEHPSSLGGFWRKHVHYGRGALGYHLRLGRGGELDSSLHGSVGTVLAAARRGAREPQLAPLIALWVVATATGIAIEATARLARRLSNQARGVSSATVSRIVETNRSGVNS